MNLHSFLVALLLLLTVLATATSLFERLRLGSVIGLIAAGIVLGPWGFHVVHDVERVRNFTELGVVLLMFTIGLEMTPGKLWTMRRLVLGLGSLQVIITGAVIALMLIVKDFPWRGAILGGLGLALSSTALGMQILQERKEDASPFGEAALAISLAQDLAIVPLLALIPLLGKKVAGASSFPIQFLEVIIALLAVFAIGRYLLPFLLRLLDRLNNSHGFVAIAFVAIAAAALLMEWAGLSMALGAFLLGMLLSGSEYQHRISAIVSPLKLALLDLFFISVGMSMDLGILSQTGPLMVFRAVFIVLVKTILLYFLARVFRFDHPSAIRTSMLLSNAGEFGFVLFGAAEAAGIITPEGFNLAALTISISMATTPLMMKLGDLVCDSRAVRSRVSEKRS